MNTGTGRGSIHVLTAGIVVLAGMLPVARYLSLIHPVGSDTLVAVLLFEAIVSVAMLAGQLHWRLIRQEVRQAEMLATALNAGRLDGYGSE